MDVITQHNRTTGEAVVTRPRPEDLIAEYGQVCQTHRVITDFRGKLLALLPLASGTGIYILITKSGESVVPTHLVAVAAFGFVVTLGLFIHELRVIRHCADLIERGVWLEDKMGLEGGQFTDEQKYYEKPLNEVIGPVGSAWLIYPAILCAWMYVAYVGFTR